MNHPEKLQDININTHGFTADDVIQDRLARQSAIREGAIRGNRLCMASESLDALAREYGIDATYSEDLDEDDMGGMF